MAKKFLFEKKVKDMKAWQLYVGQSMWVFFIGILFFLLTMILRKLSLLNSPLVKKSYGVVESIATGTATSSDGKKFASGMMP